MLGNTFHIVAIIVLFVLAQWFSYSDYSKSKKFLEINHQCIEEKLNAEQCNNIKDYILERKLSFAEALVKVVK
jgi:hypothetical protein